MTTPTVVARVTGTAHPTDPPQCWACGPGIDGRHAPTCPNAAGPLVYPWHRVVRVSCGMIEHRYYCSHAHAQLDPLPPDRLTVDAALRIVPTHRHRCHACGATIGGTRRT